MGPGDSTFPASLATEPLLIKYTVQIGTRNKLGNGNRWRIAYAGLKNRFFVGYGEAMLYGQIGDATFTGKTSVIRKYFCIWHSSYT